MLFKWERKATQLCKHSKRLYSIFGAVWLSALSSSLTRRLTNYPCLKYFTSILFALRRLSTTHTPRAFTHTHPHVFTHTHVYSDVCTLLHFVAIAGDSCLLYSLSTAAVRSPVARFASQAVWFSCIRSFYFLYLVSAVWHCFLYLSRYIHIYVCVYVGLAYLHVWLCGICSCFGNYAVGAVHWSVTALN